MASTSRRKIEISYQANTRQAVAEISRFAKASAQSLQRVQVEAKKTSEALKSIKIMGMAALFTRGAGMMTRALRAVVGEALRYRGEQDALVIGARELQNEFRRLEASIGTVVIGAISAGGGVQNLGGQMHGLADSIVQADTTAGGFVRGGLSVMASGLTFVVQASLRVAQGLTAIRDLAVLVAGGLKLAWDVMVAGIAEVVTGLLTSAVAPLLDAVGDVASWAMPAMSAAIRASQQELQGLVADVQTWRDGIVATGRETADALGLASDALVQHAQDYEDAITGAGSLNEAFQAGLENSFAALAASASGAGEATATGFLSGFLGRMAEADANRGGWWTRLGLGGTTPPPALRGGGGDREAEALGRAAGQAAASTPELARSLMAAEASKQAQFVGGAAGGAAGGVVAGGGVGGMVAAAVAAAQAQKEALSTKIGAAADEMQGIAGVFSSSLAGMSQNWFGTLGAMAGGLDDWGAALKSTLASTMGDMGSALLQAAASGIGSMAMGPLAILGLGGAAFSLAAGLLGGGSGSGTTRNARRGSAASAPGISEAIRPETSRGSQARVVQLSIGAVFSRDESRRAVSSYMREAAALGEIR